MENILSQIFTSDYNRASFEDNVLKPIFLNSVQDFVLYDEDGEQEIELSDTEKRTAKRVVKYGEFSTHDNRKIELYEVTVEDFRQVKIARVGLGALVKRLIIGNNAVFATFKYEDVKDKHWRFSFIAYDSFFEDGKVQTTETNPKRYTYVFGDKDETYRTAIDRFKELDSKFQIKVKDIQDAFAVEAMSKEFFDEYRETHYAKFVKFLTGEEFQKKGGKYELVKVQNPSPFLASVFNGDENDEQAKKDARDFCKKLLGQIVFLYFIQKKGWLGATDLNYKEGNGDKNFIQNFYNQAGANDNFYPLWLSKLFYDTLNQKRENDDFTMPDGALVKIPYLNGGLFEKESEKFDYLVFPSELFTDLFEFFNRFNFTIYENSPEEHTVAVDPEMLGHIFENLLEDNKDKGAFYTPKEIVQYMTQESLIEYLATHLGEESKFGISKFVKQKNKESLPDSKLNEINNLLDIVKICDPAIGSGAFPMGLLHEIFAIKERIAFETNDTDWNPANVKENIIQNSIYGVDIEKGAVDIAQLRFWLSLIVDEEEPKPLPNLAYKIVVGNSLVSKFGDEIIEIDWEVAAGTQNNLFGNSYQEDLQELLKQISEKQKEYFTATNSNKPRLTKEIRLLKLNILSKQLELMINTKGFEKTAGQKLSKTQTERWLETEGWKRTLHQVNGLKTNSKPFNHFDWKLDFPEILNPIVNNNTGFDIVIGNPPYKIVYNKDEKLHLEIKYDVFKRNNDLYVAFIQQSLNLLKEKGNLSFINPNTFLNGDYFIELRKLISNYKLIEVLDFKNSKVFKDPTVFVCILSIVKDINQNFESKYTVPDKNIYDQVIKKVILIPNSIKSFIPNHPIIDSVFLEHNKTFNDICLIKDVGFNYWSKGGGKTRSLNSVGKRVLYEGTKENENDVPFIKGRDIFKYKINPPSNYLKYNYDSFLNENDIFRFSKDFLEITPKLVYRQTSDKIIAAYDENKFYCDKTVHLIVLKRNDIVLLKHLLSLLNSKLFEFFYTEISKEETGRTFSQVKTTYIKKLPVVTENKVITSTIVDYIHFINSNNNIDIRHKLQSTYFEQIIDGIVYELYFPKLLQSSNRRIIEHLGILPVFSVTMSDKEKEQIVDSVFKRLDDKDHPVRNNLFYMRNIEEIALIENLKH